MGYTSRLLKQQINISGDLWLHISYIRDISKPNKLPKVVIYLSTTMFLSDVLAYQKTIVTSVAVDYQFE